MEWFARGLTTCVQTSSKEFSTGSEQLFGAPAYVCQLLVWREPLKAI